MINRTHQPPRKTTMRGVKAGNMAHFRLTTATRAVAETIEIMDDAPLNPHSRDGVKALKRAARELQEAQACADALRKGL